MEKDETLSNAFFEGPEIYRLDSSDLAFFFEIHSFTAKRARIALVKSKTSHFFQSTPFTNTCQKPMSHDSFR